MLSVGNTSTILLLFSLRKIWLFLWLLLRFSLWFCFVSMCLGCALVGFTLYSSSLGFSEVSEYVDYCLSTVLHNSHPSLFKYCFCSILPILFFWDSNYIYVFKIQLYDICNIYVFIQSWWAKWSATIFYSLTQSENPFPTKLKQALSYLLP